MFKLKPTPTLAQLAQVELDRTERLLLQARSELETAEHTVALYEQRVKRLQAQLGDVSK